MITVDVPGGEFFNEETGEFIEVNDAKLTLEHSLLSISKWESKWKKSFLDKGPENDAETLDYIRCMTISPVKDDSVYKRIPMPTIKKIVEYIGDPMTATTFCDNRNQRGKKEIVTAEIIYYWMIEMGIPMECEKWHLNRLMTLIRVCGIKQNGGSGMMNRKELSRFNRELNMARRGKAGSKG